jgi:hypothetical protein
MRKSSAPPRDINPDSPIRLSIPAALAFPDGSLTASGLRRESARGHLLIERIAGKDYTTLANIEQMRELCRAETQWETQQRRRRREVEFDLLVLAGEQGL